MSFEALALAAGGLVLVGAGAYFGAQMYASQVLRPVLGWEPNPARLGQTLRVVLMLNPRSTVDLEYIEFKLTCHRVYDAGSTSSFGIDMRSHRRRAADIEHDVVWSGVNYPAPAAFRLPAGKANFEAEMLVSGEGFPTRTDGKLKIHWTLDVTPRLRGFPSPTIRRQLQVVR